VIAGELTLSRLRSITGGNPADEPAGRQKRRARTVAGEAAAARAADDALMSARGKLADGVEELVDLLRDPDVMAQIPDVNRDNFAKHLTITKLKIENAIAIIRAGTGNREETA
jgi:hypothetical protein